MPTPTKLITSDDPQSYFGLRGGGLGEFPLPLGPSLSAKFFALLQGLHPCASELPLRCGNRLLELLQAFRVDPRGGIAWPESVTGTPFFMSGRTTPPKP